MGLSKECQPGCMSYDGGEVKHRRDCVHYPESLTKLWHDTEAELRAENARLRDALTRIDEASNHYAMIPTYSEGTLRYAHKSTRNLARAALSADPAPVAGVTVQEAAKVLLQSKEARDTAFDKMWIVATEQFSLEATNTGGARYSVTGDVINALWYEGICAIAGENDND